MTQRISRHAFSVLAFGLLTLAAHLSLPAQEVSTSAGARPNILMVIGDDMTWNDCEPYGNVDVRTPHMARLHNKRHKRRREFASYCLTNPREVYAPERGTPAPPYAGAPRCSLRLV